MATNENAEGTVPDAGFLEPTIPQPSGRFQAIDPYDDEELTGTGLPTEEPPELAGKTRDELRQQFETLQQQLAAEKARNDPVNALTGTLKELLGGQQKPKAEVTPGYLQRNAQMQPGGVQETPEARRARLNELYLSDPTKATEELQLARDQAMVEIMATNQAQLSRELVLTSAATKPIYDRYAEEVEAEVGRMTPWERFQNPRMYQEAIIRVKARHQDDFVQEQLQDLVKAELAKYGIDPSKQQPGAATVQPAQRAAVAYTPAGSQTAGQRPAATARKSVDPPKWIRDEADRIGVDPKFLYHHYQEKGVVR